MVPPAIPQPDILAYYKRKVIERYDLLQRFANPHLPKSPSFSSRQDSQTAKDSKIVGIIGGGVSGLYTALILDSLNVSFDLLEASNRVGGRLFTKKFTDDPHDYFDVGAMRFPDSPAMRRVFHLFEYLNMGEKEIIPYHFSSENSFLQYNRRPPIRRGVGSASDTYDWGFPLPREFQDISPGDIVDSVVRPFADRVKNDWKTCTHDGWDHLMEHDHHSLRSYMTAPRITTNQIPLSDPDSKPKPPLPLPPYPLQVVEWLETMTNSTGSFNYALSEAVLEVLAFDYDPNVKWKCIDGGSETLARIMEKKIDSGSIMKNFPVTHISPIPPKLPILSTLPDLPSGPLFVTSQDGKTTPYNHVISTIPLASFATVDTEDCTLLPTQYMAIRQLQYGPSIKIGMKFKDNWWKNGPSGPIVGGQSSTDRPIRTVVYPSYGIDSKVIIASYAWTSDASRLASLMAKGDAASKDRLKYIVLRDLVRVHGLGPDPVTAVEDLDRQLVDWFPYDWGSDQWLGGGAFAFFGPGQFIDLYPTLTMPAAEGRLHFAGEALSVQHAWVEGALGSAWRAVREVLWLEFGEESPEFIKFKELWGAREHGVNPDSPREDYVDEHLAIGLALGEFEHQKSKNA